MKKTTAITRRLTKKMGLFIFVAFTFSPGFMFAQGPALPAQAGGLAGITSQEGVLTSPAKAVRVPIRAARDFSKKYKGRTATWHQPNDTCVAMFTADSVTTFVGYAKSGRWIYTVRCLSEWVMPKNIRHEVRSRYYDDLIHAVFQLSYPDVREQVYLVYLRNSDGTLKVIRWMDNDLQLVKDHAKK